MLTAQEQPPQDRPTTVPARSLVVPPTPDTTLPIDLRASWSEFDRRNNRLLFRELRITQGQLAISADEAAASPANFLASTWIFTGNVVIRNAGTEATGDRAELTFQNNQLRTAVLTGKPAEFSQDRGGNGGAARGRAVELNYDVAGGSVRMAGNAALSDGTNEITGARITYDLRREVVTAGADGANPDSGPVRMRFTPPPRSAPDPTPATPDPLDEQGSP